MPVESPARAATTIFVYAGNSDAWVVPDFLPDRSTNRASSPGRAGLGVAIGEVERLQLTPPRPVVPKRGPDWRNWAEVRVRRFSEEPAAAALIRVNMRKVIARLPEVSPDSVPCVASLEGGELASYSLGQGADLLFGASLAPLSEELFQIGFHAGKRVDSATVIESHARLLASGANLVPNCSFEMGGEGPDQWIKPASGGPNRVTGRFQR